MRVHRFFQIAIFFLLFSCQSPQVQKQGLGVSSERLERYETFLQKEIDEGRLPGAVSVIARRNQIAHQAAFGKRNLESGENMAVDDIFYIQSMTKPIITVALMMLYEEGHFFLNDPVSKYLPQFQKRMVALDRNAGLDSPLEPANKEITIAHLLTHTAGLSHGLGSDRLDRQYFEAMYDEEHETVDDRVTRMLDLPLVGHPGEQWYYSAATDVLSILIAQFSNISTEEFLQNRLFAPLGMTSTGYNVPESQHHRVVKVHKVDSLGVLVKIDEGSLGGSQLTGNTIHSGVNGLFSTAGNYATFCRMLVNGGKLDGRRYLSRKTVELMTVNHVGELFSSSGAFGFGLGFDVVTDLANSKALPTEGSYSWGGAYGTYFIIDPREELVVVLMTQVDPFSSFYHQKMRQFVYQAIDD